MGLVSAPPKANYVSSGVTFTDIVAPHPGYKLTRPASLNNTKNWRLNTVKQYNVTWAINVWASSPEDAAKEALSLQRDPDSIALVFNVDGKDYDLLEEPDED